MPLTAEFVTYVSHKEGHAESCGRKRRGDQAAEDGSGGIAQARAFIGVPWERQGRAGRTAEYFQRALSYRHCP